MKQHIPEIPEFLSGGGEMGARIRAIDWEETALGPVDQWPQSLKTCVRIVLTSRQPMFVWWGPELINIYNDPYKAIVGGKHPEALGQPASVVWREIWDQVGPRAEVAMRNNEGTYDESLLLIMERNGYPEETYYTFSYSPVPGDHGGTSGIICANTDDTQRIIVERQLRTLKDIAKNIIDSKSDTQVYKKTLQVLQENPQDFPFTFIYKLKKEGKTARLVGEPPAGLPEGMLPSKIYLDQPENGLWLPMADAVRRNRSAVVDLEPGLAAALPSGAWTQPPERALVLPIFQSGYAHPFAVMVVGLNPYRLLDEKYASFFQLVADQIATGIGNVRALEEERKRAEALAAIDKAKTVFFSNISHEFRTPLTLMLGPLEDVLNQQNGSLRPQDQENLRATHRNALRLLRLVNMLLEFSRIESGRVRARYQPVALDRLTVDLASTFRSAIENAGLRYEIDCAEFPQNPYVDPEMWEKIVLNLISNAFKYTLRGHIRVSLQAGEEHAVFQVRDSGIGIPEHELPRMFERFHRVQSADGRTQEGTGIGLSLVKELVSLHGGTIAVESLEGEGSTFTVQIPFGKKHLPAAQVVEDESEYLRSVLTDVFVNEAQSLADPVEERIWTGSAETDPGFNPPPDTAIDGDARPSVLLVDDNADMRAYIRQLLGQEYRVETAVHGRAALDKIARNPPNLIISDIMMPVMDGNQLLKAVKEDPTTALIPVILLSARAGEEAKIEGFEAGADDYLVKPFSAKELLSRVRSQLHITRLRRAAERHLHNLLIQAPIAVCILRGPDHFVELCNERMLEIFGKTAQEVVNRPLFDGVPEGRGQGYETLLEIVLRTGTRFVSPERPAQLERDGHMELIYVKFVLEPLRDEDGQIDRIMVVADEITEQVLARQKIDEAEERLRLATEGTNLATWDLDLQTYAIVYSPRLPEIFGYGPGEELTHAAMRAHLHPDDADNVVGRAFDLALRNGMYDYEARIIRPGGGIYWIKTRGKVLYDEQGQPRRMLGTMMDITDQKTAALALEESQLLFKTIADTPPVGLWLTDKKGRCSFVNLTWIKWTGTSYADYLKYGWWQGIAEEDLPATTERFAIALAGKFYFSTEFRLQRPDGSLRWCLAEGYPFNDINGQFAGYAGSVADITEKKMAQEELERQVDTRTIALKASNALLEKSNRELEQFAYVASHDLQEPLRKIQTFSELLRQNLHDEAAATRYIEKIVSSSRRMSTLINDVLNYSRLSGTGDLFVKTDLNDILEHVKVDFELLIAEKQAVLEHDQLPVIRGIPLQLGQLFANLIGNSLKFSSQQPLIRISADRPDAAEIAALPGLDTTLDYVRLRFTDNGIGFEQQYAEKIFTIFQRLNDRKSSGTGIGLAICKKIVENHHGQIFAQSHPGQGSTFTVYLPVDYPPSA